MSLIPFSNNARAAEVFLDSFSSRGGFSGGGVGTPNEICFLFADVIFPLSTEVDGLRSFRLTGLLFVALPASFCFDFFPPAFRGLESFFRGRDFDLTATREESFLRGLLTLRGLARGLLTLRGLAPILFLPAE